LTGEADNRFLIAEAQIARQRTLIAHATACREDTTEAKSLLRALRYSLRLLKQQQRRAKRSGSTTRLETDLGSA
jgi:hypothetical protein